MASSTLSAVSLFCIGCMVRWRKMSALPSFLSTTSSDNTLNPSASCLAIFTAFFDSFPCFFTNVSYSVFNCSRMAFNSLSGFPKYSEYIRFINALRKRI